MARPEIFAAMPMDPTRRARFEEVYTVHIGSDPKTRDALIAQVGDRVRAVVTNGGNGLSRAQMNGMPNLEIICAVSAGYEAVDLDAARERKIPVTTGAGANASSVADHAMALLFSVVRAIPEFDRRVRDGGWREPGMKRPALADKRLGIVGLGKIGLEVAQRAGGFRMEVGYHNRNRRDDVPYAYFTGVTALAEWADFLVLSCPGGAATYHLVNAKLLTALGPLGFLVNVARGSVVDTAALVEALKNDTIAGAGLDVIEGEPAVPPDLLTVKNVVLTPHLASRSPESITAGTERAMQNLEAHFSGKPLLTPLSL